MTPVCVGRTGRQDASHVKRMAVGMPADRVFHQPAEGNTVSSDFPQPAERYFAWNRFLWSQLKSGLLGPKGFSSLA